MFMSLNCDDNMIDIFTDGACSGNPGPGGYGVILRSGKHYKEISGGYRRTTNNRMELIATIVGLESLTKPSKVRITTDSKYVVDSITKKWLDNWLTCPNFKTKKNKDLWLRYVEASKPHDVIFQWVKGHNEHEENEKCDSLAVSAYKQPDLPVDTVFESGKY